jgi:hypothetical protein
LQTWVLVIIVQIADAGLPHLFPLMYSHPHFAEQGAAPNSSGVGVGVILLPPLLRSLRLRNDNYLQHTNF